MLFQGWCGGSPCPLAIRISVSELQSVLQWINKDITIAEIGKILREVDTNNDGATVENYAQTWIDHLRNTVCIHWHTWSKRVYKKNMVLWTFTITANHYLTTNFHHRSRHYLTTHFHHRSPHYLTTHFYHITKFCTKDWLSRLQLELFEGSLARTAFFKESGRSKQYVLQ